MTPSKTPIIEVIYEDIETELSADFVTLEIDRVSTFDSQFKQTQTFSDVLSGEQKTFSLEPLENGYWYWKISWQVGEETFETVTNWIRIIGALSESHLYIYENVAKFIEPPKRRTLYTYENIGKRAVAPKRRTLHTYLNRGKYYPIWNKKRALYEYENRTDDPPFPTLFRLSTTSILEGGTLEIYGSGFGYSHESDITNEDRFKRGYGGKVFIGNQLLNIIDWSWEKITVQVPFGTKRGGVYVELTNPSSRKSNAIGLEVTQKIVDTNIGIEYFITHRNNPNTIVAQVGGADKKAFQKILNQAGSGSFEISRTDVVGGNENLLTEQNLILARVDGIDTFKWIIESIDPTYVDSSERQMIQVKGRGLLAIFENAVVYPETLTDPESLERNFTGTGGAILRTLIQEAQARGGLNGIQIDWTATEDSVGTPLGEQIETSFHAGTPLTSVIDKLANGMGLFDIEIQPDMKVKLYTRKGKDKSDEIIYRQGQGLVSHKKDTDATEVANVLLVEGDDGKIVEVGHSGSQEIYGRRESYLQARNVKQGLGRYGQMELERSAEPKWGIQADIVEYKISDEETIKPFRNYDTGDWLGIYIAPLTENDSGFDESLRVQGITVSEDDGILNYTLDLNNLMLEQQIQLKQKVERMDNHSKDSPLSSDKTEVGASRNHNHTHGTLKGLDMDDHPQYLTEQRHDSLDHSFIQRVSDIKVQGEISLTGGVSLVAGNNIQLTQNNVNKTIQITSTASGGGSGGVETIEVIATPIMQSNTLPSGIVSASSQHSATYAPWKAFDRKITNNDSWVANESSGWIAYEFPNAVAITRYAIVSPESNRVDRVPKKWTFEAWNGSQWLVLDSQENEVDWTGYEKRMFGLTNTQKYLKYRLNISESNSDSLMYLSELELYEEKELTLSILYEMLLGLQ